MDETLRFVVVRPPQPPAEEDVIRVRPSAELRDALHDGARAPVPGRALAEAAAGRRRELKVEKLQDVPLAPELVAWYRAVEGAETDTAKAAIASAQKTFGAAPAAVVAQRDFARSRLLLAESVVCYKYSGRTDPLSLDLERALRAASLLEELARAPETVGSARRTLSRTLLIDSALPRLSVPPCALRPRPDVTAELTAITADIQDHVHLLDEMDALRAADFARATKGGDPREPVPNRRTSALLVSDEARERLSARSKSTLARRGLDLVRHDLATTATRVTEHLREQYARQLDLEDAPGTMTVRMGGGVYEVKPGVPLPALPLVPVKASIPHSHGDQIPVGVGDLMVVKQQLVGYQGAELSHVENVLQGEHRSREHKRGRVTETTETLETEVTREEERDQQTTDRFELQREAATTVNEQFSLQLGASVSGSYGPSVQFSVNTEMGMDHSKEQSNKFAATTAKEVTQRLVSKITERVRRTSTLKITESFEEINIHEVDNKEGTGHVVGQYQWLDKLYEAQVFNYGQRLMFDLVVPEPAAFVLHAATSTPSPGSSIRAPRPFKRDASEIGGGNYTRYAQIYDAVGVEPPPEATRTVSKVLEGMDEDVERGVVHQTAELPIPDGYEAVSASVATDFWWNASDENKADVKVVVLVGSRILGLTRSDRSAGTDLDGEQGSIAVAMHSFLTPSVVVTVTIECKRTVRAVNDWRLRTHAAIKQGYQKQVQDYEEKVARAKAEASAKEAGAPARQTAAAIRAELKRQAVSLLTAQHFDLFGAVVDGSNDLPEIDFDQAEAEGPYIRFFEQAFEWEQMMYVFYPYFWGRKDLWVVRQLLAEDDPEFAAFLKAGAARLVPPVRPAFAEGVLHFLETGQVWSGGQPPQITSPTYVAIVDEIREQTGAPGTEVPVGEPWPIRLPTSLVKLRLATSLPSWVKQPDGSWLPAD